MKKSEIPQDESALKGWTREVFYAKNEEGKYEAGLSTGWSVKKDALDGAWEEVHKNVEIAHQLVKDGKMSPIYYFMELNLMDVSVLSQYMGLWKWRVKRHFKPEVFRKLKPTVLQRYATVFEIDVEQLKNFK